jgi:hypothetical protein
MLRVVILFPILAALLVIGVGVNENMKAEPKPQYCYDKEMKHTPCEKKD